MENNRVPVPERFRGKVAIVTGGANGIGRAIVNELCREGAAVCFTDLDEETGRARAAAWQDAGYDLLFLTGDQADERFCQEVVAKTVEKWGRLDYLVNNAFSFTAKGMDVTRADWQRVLDVGPVSYATMVQQAAEPMAASGGGAVVNVSSISAFVAQPNRWTYNAAKGAVNTLTKCQALDLAPRGIRVNSISPGWIWTQEVEKAANADGGGREKWEPVWGQYHMLERLGEPEEVAAAALFLLSDDASFITATDLPVDGGYQAMGPEGLGKSSSFAGSE